MQPHWRELLSEITTNWPENLQTSHQQQMAQSTRNVEYSSMWWHPRPKQKSEDCSAMGKRCYPHEVKSMNSFFTQPLKKIKTDNFAAEDIVTTTVRQRRSKEMDMQFYWMKDRVKQKYFFVYWKPGSQNMGGYFTKHHPPHHHREFVLRICIWKIPYLKLIIRLWTNGPMLCSCQSIRFQSRKSIRLQSLKTVLFCKGVWMPYVHKDTQIPKQ